MGETVGERFERKGVASRPYPSRRERTGARPRVARECHSAVRPSPKAVHESRDRDCNGHRILRRVPADGRYSGSPRRVGFHEKAIVGVLATSTPSDPHPRPKARGAAMLQHGRRLVRRRANPEVATGMPEARLHRHRGKNTPTLTSGEVTCSVTIR